MENEYGKFSSIKEQCFHHGLCFISNFSTLIFHCIAKICEESKVHEMQEIPGAKNDRNKRHLIILYYTSIVC